MVKRKLVIALAIGAGAFVVVGCDDFSPEEIRAACDPHEVRSFTDGPSSDDSFVVCSDGEIEYVDPDGKDDQ